MTRAIHDALVTAVQAQIARTYTHTLPEGVTFPAAYLQRQRAAAERYSNGDVRHVEAEYLMIIYASAQETVIDLGDTVFTALDQTRLTADNHTLTVELGDLDYIDELGMYSNALTLGINLEDGSQ